MKAIQVIAALGACTAGVQGIATGSSTVVCSACPSHVSSTPDIVTRSPVPTTPCTASNLTVISSVSAGLSNNATTNAGTVSWSTTTATGAGSSSTYTAVTAGGNRLIGGFSSVMVLAACVACIA